VEGERKNQYGLLDSSAIASEAGDGNLHLDSEPITNESIDALNETAHLTSSSRTTHYGEEEEGGREGGRKGRREEGREGRREGGRYRARLGYE